MSLKSWRAEFYPVDATEVSTKDALEHSIQKWKGLLPANLEKHYVIHYDNEVVDPSGDSLDIDSTSCALCHHWWDGHFYCPQCPLVKAGFRCCNLQGSAWRERYDNPERMVSELERSRK